MKHLISPETVCDTDFKIKWISYSIFSNDDTKSQAVMFLPCLFHLAESLIGSYQHIIASSSPEFYSVIMIASRYYSLKMDNIQFFSFPSGLLSGDLNYFNYGLHIFKYLTKEWYWCSRPFLWWSGLLWDGTGPCNRSTTFFLGPSYLLVLIAAPYSAHIKLHSDLSSPWCLANWTIHLKYTMFYYLIFRGVLHFGLTDSNFCFAVV